MTGNTFKNIIDSSWNGANYTLSTQKVQRLLELFEEEIAKARADERAKCDKEIEELIDERDNAEMWGYVGTVCS